MKANILERHVETTTAVAGGRPRIVGRRITVQDIVVWHERLGRSPEEIAEDHDLTLGDIHAALAYYFDHQREIDRRIASDRTFISALRKRTPSKLISRLRKSNGNR